jgi:NhaA family Na+:H+ antiporter
MKKFLKPHIFFKSEKAGGVLLMVALILSLIIANSNANSSFNSLLNTPLGIGEVNYSLSVWINDGLMAVFFLLVGLEIKRELTLGELSNVKKASLPIIAAFGGVLVPALIFTALNSKQPTAHGWGIPIATDIAFALAIITLLGKHVPASLKIFLAALAIVDDLAAILVIAVFYSSDIHFNALLIALGIFIFLLALNYFKVRNLLLYLIPGALLWYFMHHSGIHATIAGVLLAMCIPLQKKQGVSPLEKLEHALVRPVNLLIMPIFALANTNIRYEDEMLTGLGSTLGIGVIVGLFVGKTIGVSLFSFLAVKLKLASLPSGANWKHILGLGMLAGIGFTMSIFITTLSFNDFEQIQIAKFAVLIASLISGTCGFFFLKALNKHR